VALITAFKVPIQATIADHILALGKAETSCVATVKAFLEEIHLRKGLNAFLEVWEEEALKRASELDQEIADGKGFRRLHGVVIALKDNLCWKGHKMSASSKMLEGFESQITASAVQRLYDNGAIFIGRTNCDEFAMGSSNENSAFGPVQHPLDPERVPGGSSGGSAAAVGANLCHAALGTDTGGSIRQPAAFVGAVGYKPSYGRISRWGAVAFASSFDQIGPITKNVADAALLTEIMAGPDNLDATAIQAAPEAYSKAVGLEGQGKEVSPLKFAVIAETIHNEGVSPSVLADTYNAIEKLKEAGHSVEEVSFPYLDFMMPIYYLIAPAEASSNLGRYDGVRVGYRSPKIGPGSTLEELYKFSRSEGFGPEVKRRIMLGTFVLSEGYFDAYYTKAMKARRVIREKTIALFEKYDAILSPTTTTAAFKRGEKQDPIAMYLADIFTVHASIAGLPAISIPMGHETSGDMRLPLGLQLMADVENDERLFAIASTVETVLATVKSL
jgi:aspartyl-tRNA(Asn)/glutamyl-tRNA(Gln) amidotransferase subunit A